ncbi:glycoside hydrolase family 36 protein [Xylariaceae sp. FL0804]|nr:glycoside hydrolase family 36 protein [Xylariaceae sp. FL0804]
MNPRLSSYPPLGQVSQLGSQSVPFTVVLELDTSQTEEASWDVALWHSAGGGAWTETPMSPVPPGDCCSTSLQPPDSSTTCLHFGTTLSVSSSPLTFTLKYRNRSGADQAWQWVQETQSAQDGVVVVNNPESCYRHRRWAEGLSDVICRLNPELRVRSVASQAPRTRLWTVEAAIGAAGDAHSAFADVELGVPWGSFLRGVDNVMTLLRGAGSDRVVLHVRSDNDAPSHGLVLAAVGDDFESALAAVIYHARSLVSVATEESSPSERLREPDGDVKPEWMENWYDGLGYCTWNALGQNLTDEKLLGAVDSLAKNEINISSIIIDDGWQDIDRDSPDQYQRGWRGFEAEPGAFPRGLRDTVERIRSKHPAIQHVAVWHALLGYWGGISASGDLAKRYKTSTVLRHEAGLDSPMTVIAEEDVDRFYDDFYRFLSACGVEGVKTDVQYMLDTLVSARHRRGLTSAYLDGWAIAALRHFGLRAISCMSQAPQVLFRQQLLARGRPVGALLARNSDDYFPDAPAAAHPWHVWANAHNALLTRHAPSALPDWDVFQTRHAWARYHAAARCVSGGPLCITDAPGEHDAALICDELTGTTPRGRTVVFRPSVPGRSVDPYAGYDDDAILKVGAYHGRAGSGGTPLLGLFNARPRPLFELVPLARFPGAVAGAALYVVRSHGTGNVSAPLDPGSPAARLRVALDVGGSDIYTAYPVAQLDSETNGRVAAANLGLVGKMTGAAAIVTSHIELLHTGKVFLDTRLKALGTLGVYISSLPDMSVERDFMVTMQSQPIPQHTVTINRCDKHVLDIDVEAAWKEMGLKSGWSNEVEVKVYFDIEYP